MHAIHLGDPLILGIHRASLQISPGLQSVSASPMGHDGVSRHHSDADLGTAAERVGRIHPFKKKKTQLTLN